jgi:predicted nucleic acid-binding protein
LSEPGSAAFLDTSYVVRYFVDDPHDMAEQAARVIESDDPLILSESVLLEAAYVLASQYDVPRNEIVDSLMELVQRRNVLLPLLPKPRVLAALEICRNSKRYSFTDAFLWAQVLESGPGSRIYTFDRRFPSVGITVVGTKVST